MIASLWASVGSYVAAAGAFLAAILGVWWAGKRSGESAAQAAAEKADNESRRTRDAVERVVARESDPVERVRRDWARD